MNAETPGTPATTGSIQPRDEMIGALVLGRYRIVARLARGGMGVVYLARAEGAAGFAKPVVIKRILPDLTGEARMARLFIREAKILANLQHPNIVSVIDFGEEDGAYIMVLDYIKAYNLDLWWSYLQERGERVPASEIVHIMIKVLDAVDYAHTLTDPDGTSLDIVHADISPSNILVTTDGQVKLLDFGIARMRGESTQATDNKSIRGKFAYLPVEALDGSPPKVSTDIYACGVVLYELLTGENPFTGTDETRTIAKVISFAPPAVSTVRPDVSPELDAIVARAMAKQVADRFSSAKELARELRRVQALPVSGKPALGEDEVATSLGARAKRDYAEMPAKPGSSLADLEEAWRNPPAGSGPPSIRGSYPSLSSLGTTSADVPVPIAAPPPRRSQTALVIVGAFVALGLVGGGIALATMLRSAPTDPIVVIERGPSGSATTSSAGTSATTSAATPDPSEAPSSEPPGATPAPPPKTRPADPLSAALAKNQPEIERCFQSNTSSSSEISIRISIDKDGAVQRAELIPSDVGPTPLGQCLIGVTKRTKFPAQPAPATFRIPLRARKVP